MSPGSRTYGQLCGLASALDLLGDRWTFLIVRELARGPKRFGELLSGLGGMGTNLLSTRLKSLVSDGVIERVELPTADGAPGYGLTPRGRSLQPILDELSLWGLEGMERDPTGREVRAAWAAMTMRASMEKNGSAPPEGTFAFEVGEETFWLRVSPEGTELFDGRPPSPSTASAAFATEGFFAVATGARTLAQVAPTMEGDVEAMSNLMEVFCLPRESDFDPQQTIR